MSARRPLLSLGLPKDTLKALIRNGYETVQDMSSTTVEILSKDLNIPVDQAQALLSSIEAPQTPVMALPSTQSAANFVQYSRKMTTKCPPLDKILEGGLSRGQILEISGPPGSPKEKLALGLVAAFVEAGEEIVFVDCQNMVPPAILAEHIKKLSNPGFKLENIHHTRALTLPDLLLFMYQLPELLKARPKVSLLVINSISFPFQNTSSVPFQKNICLDKVKQSLSKAGALHSLTIVTTSQLATKMVNADGTPGTFDSGAKGIMLPALGPSYLPGANAHRVILAPDGLKSGLIKLLSSPKYPPGKCPSNSEPYSVESHYSVL